ncbi:MAG: alpha-amylase family glycosyl hydrolase [Bacteroidota bacterium]
MLRILALYALSVCFIHASMAVNVTFRVDLNSQITKGAFNPQSEFIDLAGNFNSWGQKSNRLSDADGDGIWEVMLTGLESGEVLEFKFRINGAWNGREEFPGAGNNRYYSVPLQHATVDFEYNVQKSQGNLPSGIYQTADPSEVEWWNDAVFYEIFVRSFYDSDGDGIGDFNGIVQKLDYLNDGDPTTDTDLGITGIWLMPIHPSPSYHGYDVTDYRGINPDYGTMADFENFLEEAHKRGIRVIIDYVMNHASTQHPWFQSASANQSSTKRNWFRWSTFDPGYNGPWGQQVWHGTGNQYYYGVFWSGMPDLNYAQPEVRTEMFDIAEYWLKDIGVDGFRLDAVKFIYENGSQLEDVNQTFDFFGDFRTFYKGVKSDAFSVGEAWTNTDKVVPYVENDRLDFCFEFDLANAILNGVNNSNTNSLIFQVDKTYNAYPYLQWGTFLTNHDQNRLMDVLGGDISKSKLAASLYLTLPGVPFIYYGEEVGMLGTKPDEDIRLPMQWTTGEDAGFTTGVPWRGVNSNYATYNVETMQADSASMWSRYRDLIEIRRKSEPLRRGEYEWVLSSPANVYSFIRYWNGDTVLVMANLSTQASDSVTIFRPGNKMAPAQVYDYLSGDSTTLRILSNGQRKAPSIEPRGVRIYRFQDLKVSNDRPLVNSLTLYPNPTEGQVTLKLPDGISQEVNYKWFDLTGRLLKQGSQMPASTQLRLTAPTDSSGIFLLDVEVGEKRYTQKVWVK